VDTGAEYTLPAGFYVAGRYDIMRFSDVKDSKGTDRSWDADVDRLEVGAGYRIMKGVTAKAVYQRNKLQPPDPAADAEILDLYAGQLSVSF
jgi:predicted porin